MMFVRRPGQARTVLVAFAALTALFSAVSLVAQQPADLFRNVVFREIGPTRQGGRYVDFAVVEATPRIYYVANATGGLWKTENNGVSFTQMFDGPVASLGAVAVAQSAPDTVYLGTGEANNSRSSYWGNGVYKSTDAGVTWTHLGLPESHHIGRIIVHPTDPNTVYVAALGKLYSENEERGLYKTTDGGQTWNKTLAIDVAGRAIGVVDIAMDPKNPNVLYAATYDKVRKPWTFAEGGPGSGIYKTTDAGRTWTKLTSGLPQGWMGRIGVAVARSAPNTVYAIIENVGMLDEARQKRFLDGFGTVGGGPAELFRSDDAGKTWRQVAPPVAPPAPAAGAGGRGAAPQGGGRGGGRSNFQGGNPPYYYAQVRVDPNDKETVYVLSVGWSKSTDGGQTWQGMGFGGDNHALWINPRDSNHILLGYDHGFGTSFDGGRSWLRLDNVPTAQFYAIGFDFEVPYNVYGGTQDNGCWKGPSTRPGGGNIPFEAWTDVGCADGFYNEVDWKDSRWLYNESQFGGISRIDQKTGQSQSLQGGRPPLPDKAEYRFNWSAPILISPHDNETIYHAAQVVLRSRFQGENWELISPDLTVNDPARRDGGGNITYATITTLDESPIVPGLLWAGTDDGNVQVSRNAGGSWTNVRDKIPGHPGYWISRVVASHAQPGTAYVTATGYRRDDFRPFIWKTTDFGATWTSIAGDLPNEAINVVRESPRNANVLFVGTDLSVYVTLDGGQRWHKLRGSVVQGGGGFGRGGGGGAGPGGPPSRRGLMPTVPVHDLKIHPRERELVIGTHGRGILIADVSEIEEMTPQVLQSEAHLFQIDPVIDWVVPDRGVAATSNFAGMSRPTDMAIDYYLRSPAKGDVKVRVYDGSRMIAELDGTNLAGVNTVRWDLEARRERIEGEAVPQGRGGRGGRGGGGGGGRAGGGGAGQAGPQMVTTRVQPGEYRIVLSVNGREYTQIGRLVHDPGVHVPMYGR